MAKGFNKLVKKIEDKNTWKWFTKDKPKTKGDYLVLYGKKNSIGDSYIVDAGIANWNKHLWNIDPECCVIKWKILLKSEADKYSRIKER